MLYTPSRLGVFQKHARIYIDYETNERLLLLNLLPRDDVATFHKQINGQTDRLTDGLADERID